MTDPFAAWLSIIAGLVNPALPAEALKALLPLKPHLQAEFDRRWLTPDSARLVAETKRFTSVPGWDVIAGTLREYIRANRPLVANRLPASKGDDWVPPTPEDIQRVSDLLRGLPVAEPVRLATAKVPDVSLSGDVLAEARERAA